MFIPALPLFNGAFHWKRQLDTKTLHVTLDFVLKRKLIRLFTIVDANTRQVLYSNGKKVSSCQMVWSIVVKLIEFCAILDWILSNKVGDLNNKFWLCLPVLPLACGNRVATMQVYAGRISLHI